MRCDLRWRSGGEHEVWATSDQPRAGTTGTYTLIHNNLMWDDMGVSEIGASLPQKWHLLQVVGKIWENYDQSVDCGVYSNRPDCVLVSFHLELLHKVKDLK